MDQFMASLRTADEKLPGPKAAHRRLAQLLDRMEPPGSIVAIMKLTLVSPRQRVSLAAEAGTLLDSIHQANSKHSRRGPVPFTSLAPSRELARTAKSAPAFPSMTRASIGLEDMSPSPSPS